jgi:hypothetical protein
MVNEKRMIRQKIYARAVVAIMLFISWGVLSLSGIVLWLAPEGRGTGQIPLLLDFTKSSWGAIHFWIAVVTVLITIIHIIIDWRALRGIIRYMVSIHRRPELLLK